MSAIMMPPSKSSLSPRGWESNIPPVLRPVIRAYLLGYASSAGPRIVTLLLQHVAQRSHGKQRDETFPESLQRILRRALDWRGFPTFCAALVGGSTLLESPLRVVFDRLAKNTSDVARTRLARWFATFISAWLSLKLLQSGPSSRFADADAKPGPGGSPKAVRPAGRTLDLTLLAVTRALDVLVGELWHRHKLRRQVAHKWTRLEDAISRLTDPALFAVSSGLVMWAWIYSPTRLPRAYNKWISSAAAVDDRLLEALRCCRRGTLRYGHDTGHATLLGSMCVDYGWPRMWGDPALSVPFPCEMVHMGTGPSCERHALSRFVRSFRWAAATYLPLFCLLALRSSLRHRHRRLHYLLRAPLQAARSSAFLGAFIALFYYGVCLARTRLGPRLLPLLLHPGNSTRGSAPAPARARASVHQRIDGGYCVAAGCVLCGWSILLEQRSRRKDIALFVAPRALATLFPRLYSSDKQWRETLAFAAATAVVFTCVLENPGRVRGFYGSVLAGVLRPSPRGN